MGSPAVEIDFSKKNVINTATINMAKKKQSPPLMLSPAVCGFPSPAEQYVDAPLDLNELLVKNPPATYFVRAAGNSMTDAGIQEGDILVVDRSIQPEDNSIVIACVDNEFTVKYLRMDGETVSLVPANKRYKPIVFTEGMELKVFGVVTAVIHQFVKREVPTK